MDPRRRLSWILVVVYAFAVAFVALTADRSIWPRLQLGTSAVVADAIRHARQDPRVTAALGTPVRARWLVPGYISTDETGWSESRTWIPIYGTKSDGTLYARAGRASGAWVFTTLEFRPKQGATLDLMATPTAESGAPRGPVYIVPVGGLQRASLDDLPAYYKTLLGLDVFLLPSIPLVRDAYDQQRRQYAAEPLIGSIRERLPEVARGPDATVVAVLDDDLFAHALSARYLLAFRGDGHVAVVALKRLAPPIWQFWSRDRVLNARMRKMITKNIGIVAYGLPLSDDPTSVLYGGIDMPQDLDLMRERFDGLGNAAELRGDPGTHRAAPIDAEIVRRTDPATASGRYPCLVVHPGLSWDGTQPIDARITECLPGLRNDRTYDEVEIDLRAGMLMTRQTDLFIPDVMPLALTRCYRLWDRESRAFGIGWNHPYDVLPVGSRNPYTYVNLIMPDGASIHYDRISKGTGYADAVYEHTDTATAFLRSEFRWNGLGWDLRFADGSVMTFPENYGGTQPHHGAPTEMRDGTGHKIQFARDSDRNLDKLTAPAGHSISFEHDTRSRVATAATDTAQAVQYAYDAGGRLTAVTAGDRVTRFGYDDLNLISVDVSGKRVLAVAYKDDRVASLTAADGRTYTFNYLTLGTDANRVTETIVYAPDGTRTRIRLPRDRN